VIVGVVVHVRVIVGVIVIVQVISAVYVDVIVIVGTEDAVSIGVVTDEAVSVCVVIDVSVSVGVITDVSVIVNVADKSMIRVSVIVWIAAIVCVAVAEFVAKTVPEGVWIGELTTAAVFVGAGAIGFLFFEHAGTRNIDTIITKVKKIKNIFSLLKPKKKSDFFIYASP